MQLVDSIRSVIDRYHEYPVNTQSMKTYSIGHIFPHGVYMIYMTWNPFLVSNFFCSQRLPRTHYCAQNKESKKKCALLLL
jgi:hypothetical protein